MITFSLYYFFHYKLFLIWYLQFILVKRSKIFFSFKMTNNICPRNSVFNFFNDKNFFRPIWNIAFCKNVSVFRYSNYITNFKFRILIISFLTRFNICAWFSLTIFILIVLWYVLLYLLTLYHLIYQYTHFLILKLYTYKFHFFMF